MFVVTLDKGRVKKPRIWRPLPLFINGITKYSKATMDKAFPSIDFTKMDLEPEVQQLIEQLMNHIEVLAKESRELKEENQRLRDEIARLKGGKGKPEIKANRRNSENDEGEDQKESKKRKSGSGQNSNNRKPRSKRIKIDREETISLDRNELPDDVEPCGYRDVIIQNIIFRTDNVRYRLEKMYSPSTGKHYEAKMPKHLANQSYDSDLEALVIMFYFQLRVTQNKIHQLLISNGIVISEGQISNIITKKHLAKFSKGREEIVKSGLKTSQYHQIDDTGARENGINHHTFVLGNTYYSSFFTKRYKNKDTVKKLLTFLDEPPENQEASKELKDFLKILIGDDAPQFHDVTLYRGLCWWHEVRLFEKLHPAFDYHQNILDDFIGKLWDYYDRLVEYKISPSEKFKEELSAEFDDLLSTVTGYDDLDHRIALTCKKKSYLLLVLDYPEIPLDNNLSERDLREIVIKRKISNGTRTKEGTKSWDVFFSILGTCQKNNVNFYDYLRDRISAANEMPSLASVLLKRSRGAFEPIGY